MIDKIWSAIGIIGILFILLVIIGGVGLLIYLLIDAIIDIRSPEMRREKLRSDVENLNEQVEIRDKWLFYLLLNYIALYAANSSNTVKTDVAIIGELLNVIGISKEWLIEKGFLGRPDQGRLISEVEKNKKND